MIWQHFEDDMKLPIYTINQKTKNYVVVFYIPTLLEYVNTGSYCPIKGPVSQGYATHPLRTISAYSTYESLAIRDTCAICIIHFFPFGDVHRCPSRVLTDGSLRHFSL